MKRIAAMALAAGLLMGQAALGAEDAPRFSDVEAGSWYERGVAVCAEAGLMEGVGDGRFSPGGALSYEELVVLSARLHHILTGGDGELPQAPEGYRTAQLAFADGSPAPFQMDACVSQVSRGVDNAAYFGFPEEMAAAYAGRDFILTLHLDETRSYAGTLEKVQSPHPTLELYDYELRIPRDTWEETRALFDDVSLVQGGPVPDWCADAFCYADREDLFYIDRDAMGQPAKRDQLLSLTARAIPEGALKVINQVEGVPDLPRLPEDGAPVDLLELYRAGVVTGSDEYGTFYGGRGLTRAEAAVLLARVLQPELRVEFQLEEPEYLSYTLSPLPDRWREAVLGQAYPALFCGELAAVLEGGGSDDPWLFWDASGSPVEPGADHPIRDYADRMKGIWFEGMVPEEWSTPLSYGYDFYLFSPFVDGLATVQSGGCYGYFRDDGTMALPFLFRDAGPIVDGAAIVKTEDGYFLLTLRP